MTINSSSITVVSPGIQRHPSLGSLLQIDLQERICSCYSTSKGSSAFQNWFMARSLCNLSYFFLDLFFHEISLICKLVPVLNFNKVSSRGANPSCSIKKSLNSITGRSTEGQQSSSACSSEATYHYRLVNDPPRVNTIFQPISSLISTNSRSLESLTWNQLN